MPDLKFNKVAAHYGRGRPAYPDVVYNAMLAKGEREHFDCGVDFGCGAGQSLDGLAKIADTVIGVEGSAEMAAEARNRHPNFQIINKPVEENGLDDRSADLLTAATAFHWFDRPRALAEAARLLRPGGVLALYTYRFPVIIGPGQVIMDRHTKRYWLEYKSPKITGYDDTLEVVQASGLFEGVERRFLDNAYEANVADVIAFTASTSYASRYMNTLDDPDQYLDDFASEIRAIQPEPFQMAFDLSLVMGVVG